MEVGTGTEEGATGGGVVSSILIVANVISFSRNVMPLDPVENCSRKFSFTSPVTSSSTVTIGTPILF